MALDPRLRPAGSPNCARRSRRLHEAGIGAILDLVFNHTGESDAFGPTLSLRGLDNWTYYRHCRATRRAWSTKPAAGNTSD